MPVKSKKSMLSIHPDRVPKIMEFGEQNNLHNGSDELCLATICKEIVYRVVKAANKSKVQEYLEQEGGDFFNLMEQGIHQKTNGKSP